MRSRSLSDRALHQRTLSGAAGQPTLALSAGEAAFAARRQPLRRFGAVPAMTRQRLLAIAACGLWAAAAPAWALFGDDEARQQIKELRAANAERFETQSRAQLDLANQIEQLRGELARLRGQLETVNYEIETAKKRQQDFYVDLDGRLRRIEAPPAEAPAGEAPEGDSGAASAPAAPAASAASKADPADDARAYEAALNQFKAGKYKEAAAAFAAFVSERQASDLAPSAQYWLGNSYYGLRDCKKAIAAHKVVVALWSEHARAPDALLNIAACQEELGESKAARQTLEEIVKQHKGTPAAEVAAKRLKKK